MLFLTAWAASQDVEKGQSRLQIHKLKLMYEGAFIALPPYGYFKPRKHFLQPHETHREVVREIFEMAGAGKGATEICKILNARGTPATKGGKWNPTVVGRMLLNPIYIGWTEYNVKALPEEFAADAIHQRWNPTVGGKALATEDLLVSGAPDENTGKFTIARRTPHTQIVDLEVWARVHARLKIAPVQAPPSKAQKFLFLDVFHCQCGKRLSVYTPRWFDRRLICPDHRFQPVTCQFDDKVSLRTIEQAAIDGMMSVLKEDVTDFRATAIEELRKDWLVKHEHRASRVAEVARLRRELDEQIAAFRPTDPDVAAIKDAQLTSMMNSIRALNGEIAAMPSEAFPEELENPRLPTFGMVMDEFRRRAPFQPRPDRAGEIEMFARLQEYIVRASIEHVGSTSYDVRFRYDFSAAFGLPAGTIARERVFSFPRKADLSVAALSLELARDTHYLNSIKVTDEEFAALTQIPGIGMSMPSSLEGRLRSVLDAVALVLFGFHFWRTAAEVCGLPFDDVVRLRQQMRRDGTLELIGEALIASRPNSPPNVVHWPPQHSAHNTVAHKLKAMQHPVMHLSIVNTNVERTPELTDAEWAIVEPALELKPLATRQSRRQALDLIFASIRGGLSVKEMTKGRADLRNVAVQVGKRKPFNKAVVALLELEGVPGAWDWKNLPDPRAKLTSAQLRKRRNRTWKAARERRQNMLAPR